MDDDNEPFTKPIGSKPGRPVVRRPVTFLTELGSTGLVWGTAHWALNGLMTSEPRPGTFSYVMKNRIKGYSTPYGKALEAHADEYVVKHGLENDIDGRSRGMSDFFRNNKPTSTQLAQLAKQAGVRALPFAISGVLAFGITKSIYAVDKDE